MIEEGTGVVETSETNVCKHPDAPHTVWWMVEDGDPIPVPREARFDDRAAAVEAASKLPGNPQMLWAKVFRSDNESYTCWHWTNPDPPRPAWADMGNKVIPPDPVGFPVGPAFAALLGLVAIAAFIFVVTHS